MQVGLSDGDSRGWESPLLLSEIMPTTAEIVAAQRWFASQPTYYESRQDPVEKAKWRETTALRLDYVATLSGDEKKIFYDDNKAYAAEIEDAIDRQLKTQSREHLQAFTKTAATFVAAGFAAPLLFGPATGGLYASGSAAGGAAAAGGTGSVALTPADSSEPPPLNVGWRDNPLTPTSQEVIAPYTTKTSFANVLGDIVGGAAKILPAVAAVIPKVGAAINVFGGGTEVQTPGTSQPVIVPSGSPGLPGLPESMDQPYNIFMPGSAGQPGTGTAPPIFFQTAADGSTTPNYLFYIAIAIVGFILLKKR